MSDRTYSKDIGRDRQIKDVGLRGDDNILGDVLGGIHVALVCLAHGIQLDTQLNMQTCRHLDGRKERRTERVRLRKRSRRRFSNLQVPAGT